METSGVPRSIPASYANFPAVRRATLSAALGARRYARAEIGGPRGYVEEGSVLNLVPIYLGRETVRIARVEMRYIVNRAIVVDPEFFMFQQQNDTNEQDDTKHFLKSYLIFNS